MEGGRSDAFGRQKEGCEKDGTNKEAA